MVGPDRPLIVLFGASIVQFSYDVGGWGAILADLYSRKADILLRGYAGWNTRRALEKLDVIFPKDCTRQPALVIVFFGGNDSAPPHPTCIGSYVPIPEYMDNLKTIANHLKGLSEATHVIFMSCPPVNEDMVYNLSRSLLNSSGEHPDEKNEPPQQPMRTNELAHQYSDACITVCKRLGMKVVDLWTAIQRRPDWKSACLSDGVHLSAEGSIIVVEELLEILKAADWEPSLYWERMPSEYSESSPFDTVLPNTNIPINLSNFTGYRSRQWK